MPSFHFGRNGCCKVAGSKQKFLNKKVVILWNPLLQDVPMESFMHLGGGGKPFTFFVCVIYPLAQRIGEAQITPG